MPDSPAPTISTSKCSAAIRSAPPAGGHGPLLQVMRPPKWQGPRVLQLAFGRKRWLPPRGCGAGAGSHSADQEKWPRIARGHLAIRPILCRRSVPVVIALVRSLLGNADVLGLVLA